MGAEWAVETTDLGRTFKTRGQPDKVALGQINLQIPTGEVFGLLGPNGAGKTTLIKILATLLLPSTGKARVLGMDVENQVQALRWRINMVSGGENSGYGILTVTENLHLFGQLYGLPYEASRRRISELLEIVGLTEAAKVRYNQLSTGMKQKLQFARGFISDPLLLFLDEPTLGLDVAISRQIRAYVKQWVREKPGRTLLLTTHYMAEADELCDRVAIIDQGRIIALDTPANLKRQAVPELVLNLETSLLNGDVPERVSALPGGRRAAAEHLTDSGRTRWTLLVEDDAAVGAVLGCISTAGAAIVSLQKADPTLEDVFLKLCGRKLSEGGGPA